MYVIGCSWNSLFPKKSNGGTSAAPDSSPPGILLLVLSSRMLHQEPSVALDLLARQQPLQVGQHGGQSPPAVERRLHLFGLFFRQPRQLSDRPGMVGRQVLQRRDGQEVDVVPEVEEQVVQSLGGPAAEAAA